MMRWLKQLAGRSSVPDIPTVDIYFFDALSDLVSRGRRATEGAPVLRLGPHMFACRDVLVIVRYATAVELARAERRAWRAVYYVLDDMLPIAARATDLPPEYRARLVRFVETVLPRIMALRPVIVAPSEAIRALFPGRTSEHLDPAALSIAPDHAHFDGAVTPASPLKLAFLATRSHGAGAELLASVMEEVAARGLPYRLTLFFGRHLPRKLHRLPGIDNRPALNWPQFRAFVARERFHLLLAPLPDTPFNAGRSLTKVLDAASVGACGLFSDRAPFAGVIEPGRSGLLLPDQPEAWAREILRLGGDLQSAQAMAQGAAELARRVGDRGRVRRFWLERFGIADPQGATARD